MHDDFYSGTLSWLLETRILKRDMRILVVCGSHPDKEVLSGLGFRDVMISNLDVRLKGDEFAPFAWSHQDAEHLTFRDGTFDFAIVHNGLHHCYSPHRALLEMYRVSKQGLVVFEPRDTLFVRLGVRLNFGQDYEVAAVVDNQPAFGGVKNTFIPNYVYRWTEREVEKTISSFAPWGRHRFLYRYALRVPWARLKRMKNRLFYSLIRLLLPLLRLLFRLFPRQANGFAFVVVKSRVPEDLHPWLRVNDDGLVLNEDWVRSRYCVPKSPGQNWLRRAGATAALV